MTPRPLSDATLHQISTVVLTLCQEALAQVRSRNGVMDQDPSLNHIRPAVINIVQRVTSASDPLVWTSGLRWRPLPLEFSDSARSEIAAIMIAAAWEACPSDSDDIPDVEMPEWLREKATEEYARLTMPDTLKQFPLDPPPEDRLLRLIRAVEEGAWQDYETLYDDVFATKAIRAARAAAPLLFAAIHAAVANFFQELNTEAPIFRLPAELLSSVAVYLDWRSRFNASSVCRHWRYLFLQGSPHVWRRVNATHDYNSYMFSPYRGTLSRVLALSGAADLWVQLSLGGSEKEDLVRCSKDGSLGTQLARCTYLDLHIRQEVFMFPEVAEIIYVALCQEMPRLQVFSLCTLSSNFDLVAQSSDTKLFAGSAPLLRRVVLEVPVPGHLFGNNRFPSVTQLILPLQVSLSLETLSGALSIFPSVTQLALYPMEETEDTTLSWILALPPRLDLLVLYVEPYAAGNCARILDSFRRDRPSSIWIRCQAGDVLDPENALEILIALANTCPSMITSMRFDHVHRLIDDGDREHSPLDDDIAVYAWTSEDGRTIPCYGLLDIDPDAEWSYGGGILLRLTALSLDETLFGLHPDFPTLPALEVLTIGILPPPAQHNSHFSIFLLPRSEPTVYVFPALRALTLAVTWRDTDACTTRIAPEVLREFIENHMQYDATHIQTLTLRGLFVIETIPAEIAA
ncbi:hypothetical protein EXIGLDRAFT_729780, partial [Exidia glandulosa HHB12029]